MSCVKSALISNPVFLTTLLVGIITWCSGCSIGYRSHHDSELLRLYRTSPVAAATNSEGHGHFEDGLIDSHQSVKPSESDRVSFVSEIEPAWAKEVLYVYEKDFEVALAQVAPVNVYIDHRPDSGEKSHFNRLTRSIVLKAGQAALPRIYLHELSHLFLNEIQSFPPYWIDQGVAEYMESRYVGSPTNPWRPIVAPGLSRGALSVCTAFDGPIDSSLARHLSREAIDGGWGWSVQFIHYLFDHRWRDRPLPEKLRLLLALDEVERDSLAPAFLEYCRGER